MQAAYNYLGIINILKQQNLIDGIGLQCHEFNVNNVSVSTMNNVLNLLATTGLPIYVTELDISGNPAGSEASQYQIYMEKFPVLWEHPSVAGVTLWGYISGATWKDGTGIVASNNTERSAMQWLRGYMASEQSHVENQFSGVFSVFSNEIKIYPNPATDFLFINNKNLSSDNVQIMDITSRIIVNCKLSTDNSINVSHLPKGIYFIKFNTENGENFIEKFLVK
jgi:hypothetical protein